MLHRLALRVLPRLALAVTEVSVSKRKRLVMLVPGFLAFAIYRLLKHVIPLADPVTLLCVSGLISSATAVAAYRIGRRAPLSRIWEEDGARRVMWLVGWIGFVYGAQLSLMVLALLKILVNYDFLLHPEGPAMMAIIIACTSVARDAFEIGHVGWLQHEGKPVLTFPDGAPLRALLWEQPARLFRWSLVGGAISGMVALALSALGDLGRGDIGQLVGVTAVGGSVALWAYLAGQQRPGGLWANLGVVGWAEMFRFWWWPGLAFTATYYLVLAGALTFLLRVDGVGAAGHATVASIVAGLMAIYGYYLGYRRFEEDRVEQAVPASLLRCPFVLGILSKHGWHPGGNSPEVGEMGLEESRVKS